MSSTTFHDLSARALAQSLKARVHEIGFDLVGIAPADFSAHQDYFRRWLDDGHAGSMAYLANRFEERTNPATYLPDARSVICVAMNYQSPLQDVPPESRATHGKIARYALGVDYHEIIKSRLHELADWIRATVPARRREAAWTRRRSWKKNWPPAPVSGGWAKTPASSTPNAARGCCWAKCSPRLICQPMSRWRIIAAHAPAASTPARPAPSPRRINLTPADASRTSPSSIAAKSRQTSNRKSATGSTAATYARTSART